MKILFMFQPIIVLLVVTGLLGGASAAAQEEAYVVPETLTDVIDLMDSNSQNLLAEEMAARGLDLEQVRQLNVSYSDSERAVQLQTPAGVVFEESQKQFLVMLGTGAGLIHNLGVEATVLRRNQNGRLTWFLQGDLDYLQARVGYAPNKISAGVGIFPFRKPVVSIAMKVDHATYTPKLGFGPELSVNKFFGQSQRVMVSAKLDAPIYLGEKNIKGQNFTVLPELKLGVAIRLFGSRRR